MKIAHMYGKNYSCLQYIKYIALSFILLSAKQHYLNKTISKETKIFFSYSRTALKVTFLERA